MATTYERQKKYFQSEKGKEANRKYRRSNKGKKKYATAQKRWHAKKKGVRRLMNLTTRLERLRIHGDFGNINGMESDGNGKVINAILEGWRTTLRLMGHSGMIFKEKAWRSRNAAMVKKYLENEGSFSKASLMFKWFLADPIDGGAEDKTKKIVRHFRGLVVQAGANMKDFERKLKEKEELEKLDRRIKSRTNRKELRL